MRDSERKEFIEVTLIEKRFLEFCRDLKYAKLEIEVLEGQPKRVFRAVQSFRLDLTDYEPSGKK